MKQSGWGASTDAAPDCFAALAMTELKAWWAR